MTVTPPFRILFDAISAKCRLPAVEADRCVHDRIGQASCRACADTCPRGAWIIDDERLGIDVNACDGCGLCVPACPESAISSDHALNKASIRAWKGHPALFRACERINQQIPDAWAPCLHTTGTRELLRLYRRGVAAWITAAADCDACLRGQVQRLPDSVQQANALLQSRGLQPIVLVTLEFKRWLELFEQSTSCTQNQAVSTRRHFFRGALRTAVNSMLAPDGLIGEGHTDPAPPATWLPDTGPEDLFLHSPTIDPLRCNGCDACLRLCPHQVITLETSENEGCYRIEARHCTGCGICRDICDQGAIGIETLQPRSQTAIPLIQGRCPICDSAYHLPKNQLRSDGLCLVCARTRHSRCLYQVLK